MLLCFSGPDYWHWWVWLWYGKLPSDLPSWWIYCQVRQPFASLHPPFHLPPSLPPSLTPSFYPSLHLSSLLPPSLLLYLPHIVIMSAILPWPCRPRRLMSAWRRGIMERIISFPITAARYCSKLPPSVLAPSHFFLFCPGSKPCLSLFQTTSILIPNHFSPSSIPLLS